MAGLTTAYSQTVLDAQFVSGDYIAWSVNGTSEWANLARTSIGSWASATAADPSVKANAGALTSAAVTTAGGTVSHFAIYSAVTAGTQKTDWQTLTASRALLVGDQLTVATGAIGVTLT